MADQTAVPAGVPLIPTQAVNHFALAFNATEILISAGHTRVAMSDAGGVPTPHPVVEWLLTLSMSPTAAKALSALLASGIQNYESTIGSIPMDPAFKVQMSK